MVIDEFLCWIETAPLDARIDAADALARACLYSDLKNEDRHAVEAALLVLLDDPSYKVREKIALVLASHPHSPRAVLMGLLSDQPAIAALIVKHSPALLNHELIEAVTTGSATLQLAVAGRSFVHQSVSAALAEAGSLESCLALLQNPQAAFATITFRRLIERFGDDFEMRTLLTERDDLPLDLRQYMLVRVGEAMRSSGLVQNVLSENRLDTIVHESLDKATLYLCNDLSDEDLLALAEHLRLSDQLRPSLLLRALLKGQVSFLAAALASSAGMDLKRVQKLILQGQDNALQAMLKKSGLPSASHFTFVMILKIWRIWKEEAEHHNSAFVRFIMETLNAVATEEPELNHEVFSVIRRYVSDILREDARELSQSVRNAA
jgi:uncharacterized protein (DUF2336 family)